VLAGRGDAVVATNAIAKNSGVIEDSGCPRDRVVAIVALIAGGDMSGRLSGRLDAVVTGGTTAGQGRVIHKSNCAPTGGDMTVRALSGCIDMIRGF